MGSVIKETFTEDKLRGVVLLGVVAAILALTIMGKPIPDYVISLASLVVGYYFGRGVTNSVHARKG